MSNPVISAPEAGPQVTWQEGELIARRASSVRKAKRLALLAAGWVAMLLVWNMAAYYLPPGVLPSPLEVLTVMWEIVVSGAFVENFWGSVSKTFLGFLVAIVILLIFVPLIFPDGRLLSRRWRLLIGLGVLLGICYSYKQRINSFLKIGLWAWLWKLTPMLMPPHQPSHIPAPNAKPSFWPGVTNWPRANTTSF